MALNDAVSLALPDTPGAAPDQKLGWKFPPSTTAYAFMQTMGVINDQMEGCITRMGSRVHEISFHTAHLTCTLSVTHEKKAI